jgi:hypothetical protein
MLLECKNLVMSKVLFNSRLLNTVLLIGLFTFNRYYIKILLPLKLKIKRLENMLYSK